MQEKPELIVIVDTEEEFDWNAPFERSNRDVSHIDNLLQAQDIFDQYGIKPVYACTHPILTTPSSRKIIDTLFHQRHALIGAHLHPWVTPPFDESISEENSFPGNLPYDTEAAKIKTLTHILTEMLGKHPQIYFAGRYGLGGNTHRIIQEQEYLVDVSMAPPQNYSQRKGPDYSYSPNEPFWIGQQQQQGGIYCIPTTGEVTGLLSGSKKSRQLNRLVRQPLGQKLHIPGILSGLGLLDAVRLTPEGNTLHDMQKLTDHLIQKGHTTFAMNFHSPSLAVGHTPYAQTRKQRDELIERLHAYLAYFKNGVGGGFTDPITRRNKAVRQGKDKILQENTIFVPWGRS